MKLIAKKPCSFGGKRFFIGEDIPAELVLNPQEQEKLGVLSIAGGVAAIEPGGQPAVVPLVIRDKDGDTALTLDLESIQTVVDVLTSNADDAAALIDTIENDDVLFLLYAADSRKTVKSAAKARAQALAEEAPEIPGESAGDQ